MKKIVVGVIVAILAFAGLLAATGSASAVNGSGPGNFNSQPATRVVDVPGVALANGGSVTVQVAGHAGVPTNATAAFLQLTSYQPSTAGTLTVFQTGAGAPGTPTLSFAKGAETSVTVPVTFGANGDVTVKATGTTRFLLTVIANITPVVVQAAAPSATTTGATNVTNRDDSGDNGDWAKDAFTRTLSVTRHAQAPVANCGATSGNCWFYTATISDNGTFKTDDSAASPRAGVTINGTVVGTFSGGEAVEFYASTDTAVQPASSISGDSPSTTDWVKQDFAAGTHFSSVTTKDGWSWTYVAPNTCEQWVDAQTGETGDITGVNACS